MNSYLLLALIDWGSNTKDDLSKSLNDIAIWKYRRTGKPNQIDAELCYALHAHKRKQTDTKTCS